MIIWLASYPKSGNTLLRSLLASYFFSKDGDFQFNHLNYIKQFPATENFTKLGIDLSNENEVFQNFIEAQNLINKENGKIKFIKTHSSLCKINNYNFTDLKNTLGVIYIVRDPRNVVTSFAHHYNLNIEKATDTLIDATRWLVKTEKMYKTFLGSWNVNYNSWKQLNKRFMLIKYEDLVNKKKTTLIKTLKFIQTLDGGELKINSVKLNKVIKSTEFYKMQTLEKKETFAESIIDNDSGIRKVFFNLGPQNDWKKILDDKSRKKIEVSFKKEMSELGYL
tara:strand:- start:82 stop:918 length:837 start_codon:yes stop_codon:yes gene_type:complete